MNRKLRTGRISPLIVCCTVLISGCGSRIASQDSSTFLTKNDRLHGGIREYCMSTDPFEAQCLKNEVIVMQSAVYGRMRMGRCLEDEGRLSAFGNDPKYLGCSIDILHLLDKKCSGLNRCEVRGTLDDDLRTLKPCHVALRLYLEASFKCVSVIEEDRSCTVSVSSTAQHIMRSSSTKLSCGTKSQPWMLEAPAGQQINVSLLDFGNTEHSLAGQHHHQYCSQFGYIVEDHVKTNISNCMPGYKREKSVYKSLSNGIEIVLYNHLETDVLTGISMDARTFLLELKAIGCTNLVPPEDTWLRRNNNEAVVGCYSSRQTWHLRCVDNQWIGVIGNCTRDSFHGVIQDVEAKFVPIIDYQVVVIVAIAVLMLVICSIVICTAAVCLKRHYAVVARKQFHQTEGGCNRAILQPTSMLKDQMRSVLVPNQQTNTDDI